MQYLSGGRWSTPLTPPEFFIQSLLADGRDVCLEAAGPGADVPILLKVHVEATLEMCTATSAKSRTYVLVVRVETPLPTGGIHAARLDSWKEACGSAPLWLVGMPLEPAHPLRFACTLGWLYIVVSAIEARPARHEGDVWWRLLKFVNNVKEAYRVAPPSQAHPRPRPRPRRDQKQLSDLTEAFAALTLTDCEGQDADEAES